MKSMIIFKQSDPRWANCYLGASKVKMGRNGCTTCAVAMKLVDFGLNIEPDDLARSVELYTTDSGLMKWKELEGWIAGRFPNASVGVLRYAHRYDQIIRDHLKPNYGVILEVANKSHWLAADRPSMFRNDYECRDSFMGAYCKAIKNWGNITGFTIISVLPKTS